MRSTRTELLWPGKQTPEAALDFPAAPPCFAVVEEDGPGVVVLSGASRPAPAVRREPGPPAPAGWKNRLLHGDNLDALRALLPELAGKVDLLYIDPPFATGAEFHVEVEVGERAGASRRRRPAVASRAYEDDWGAGLGAYLAHLHPRLLLLHAMLAPEGSILVHVDRRAAHHVKLLLDEVFGARRLINEIVWCYTGPGSPGMRGFANKHDTIFWYARGTRWTFNADPVRLPYKESTRRNEGRRTGFTTGNPDLVVKLNPLGKHPEDWWLIPVEAPASRLRTPYPTQKPERLLERVILAASNPGSLVADFYCGSGTALAVAEKLGRRWIGCDASLLAIQTVRRRLLEIEPRSPFAILSAAGNEPPAGGRDEAPLFDAAVSEGPDREVRVEITGFHAPASRGATPSGAAAGRKWSDPIDSWFVDWEAEGGVFRPGFAAFRSRRDRALALAAGPHVYAGPGERRLAVKVVDVFGNETVQSFPAAVFVGLEVSAPPAKA